MNYYDMMLCGIGTLLIAGGITAALTGPLVIIVFSLAAVGLMGHAMFFSPLAKKLNTPEKEESNTLQTQSLSD